MHVTASSRRVTAAFLVSLYAGLMVAAAQAAPILKATTGASLTDTASWDGGALPTAVDVATWGAASGGTSLGGSLTWGSTSSPAYQGIDIQSASAAIALSTAGANPLTLGSAGITIASIGVDLAINSSRTFGATSSSSIGSGRTLTLSGGTTTFAAGTTTTISGSGTITLGGSNHTITGSGGLTIESGVRLNNNLQSGGTSSGFSGSVTLEAGAAYYQTTSLHALGTGTLTINGGTIGSGTGSTTRTISNPTSIGGDFTFANTGGASGVTTFSGDMDLGGQTRQITSSITGAQGGSISGIVSNGGITKAGTGTLTLSGANTYAGATTVNAGSLAIGLGGVASSSSLSLSGANTRLFVGVNGTTNVNNLSGVSTATIRTDFTITGTSGSRALSVNQTADATYAGTFVEGGSRPISLTKTGSAILTLSGVVGYSGTTTVDGGTLRITNTLQNSSSFTANTAATLELGATNVFVAGHGTAVADSRLLTVNGGTLLMTSSMDSRIGNVTLNNAATWTSNRPLTGFDVLLADTTAGAATVAVTGSGASVMNGSGGIHLQGVQNFAVADVTGSSADDLTVSMILDGPGSIGGAAGGIAKSGLGTMALANANTYTGATTISAGTLALGTGGTTGSLNDASSIDIGVGATLHWNRSNSDTGFGNPISGSGTFLKSGAGELGLTGTNTFSGLIDVQAGKIGIQSSGSVNGSPSVTIAAGATLSVGSGFSNGTATIGNLSGAGSVDTAFGGSNDIRTLSITQATDGSFAGTLTNAATGSRLLAITKAGPATLTLSGTNTYTGATTVDAGTLRVNGSLAAGSAVTVQAAGTLGGSGTIGGATTIFGTHSPGASPGVQTFGSDLGYDGATVIWELTSNTSTQTDPAVFDQVIVGNNLDFTSATSLSLVFDDAASSVDWNDAFWNTDQEWLLYDVAGTTTNLGNLSISTASWVDGFGNVFATVRPDASFSVRQATGSGDVLLSYVAVPEPGTLALAACGLALAGWHLARRRKD